MAIRRFKVALNNARFPLVSTKAQRAAFVQGLTAAACSLGTDRGLVRDDQPSGIRIPRMRDVLRGPAARLVVACAGA